MARDQSGRGRNPYTDAPCRERFAFDNRRITPPRFDVLSIPDG